MSTSMRSLGQCLGPITAMIGVALAATAALAQPGDTIYPKTCTANSCVVSGFTNTVCYVLTDVGCCCKFTGMPDWKCVCTDQVTCTTDPMCRPNTQQ